MKRRTWKFPRPFSLNNKDVNTGSGRAKSRAYKAWIAEAQAMMMAQGPRTKFEAPVAIRIRLGSKNVSPQMDGDNCIKPILDVLVSMGVIEDDNRTVVVAGYWAWRSDMDGCEVTVEEIG